MMLRPRLRSTLQPRLLPRLLPMMLRPQLRSTLQLRLLPQLLPMMRQPQLRSTPRLRPRLRPTPQLRLRPQLRPTLQPQPRLRLLLTTLLLCQCLVILLQRPQPTNRFLRVTVVKPISKFCWQCSAFCTFLFLFPLIQCKTGRQRRPDPPTSLLYYPSSPLFHEDSSDHSDNSLLTVCVRDCMVSDCMSLRMNVFCLHQIKYIDSTVSTCFIH
jgi:hypothetical protein